MSGLFPVMASNGVLFIRECGSLFLMYTACVIANDQYSGPKSDACSRHRIILPRYLLGLLATAFCADASAPVNSRVNPSASTIFWKFADLPSSLPWSVRTVL